jgi:uncharacterized protein
MAPRGAPRPARARLLRAAGLALLLLVVAPACVAMLFEERLIYFPIAGGVGPPPAGGEDVWLDTADGGRVHGWWLPREGARVALLFLHGNAGNLEHRRGILEGLRELGAGVLAIDYRGYGRSPGSPSEAGLHADARAAHDWLAARVDPARIVVYGESLGGGPACELAATAPVGGLVLQSAFTSVPDMAARVVPWLPGRWLVRTRFDNLAKVGAIACPKLVLHSRADEVVPFAHGERLFAAAREPRECVWIGAAGHNDPVLGPGSPFRAALASFLERVGA